MIIDCRCRLTVGGAADYFVDRVTLAGKMEGVPALLERTHEAFFAELDGAGVTTAVSVSGCNPGARLGRFDLPARSTSNDLQAEMQRAHPRRFVTPIPPPRSPRRGRRETTPRTTRAGTTG